MTVALLYGSCYCYKSNRYNNPHDGVTTRIHTLAIAPNGSCGDLSDITMRGEREKGRNGFTLWASVLKDFIIAIIETTVISSSEI